MLLKSFENMQKLKFNIKIVPVCINYDRIFDSHYLANEMISGKFRHLNTPELMRRIYNKRKGKLGKIFVKYAEPIDLNNYIDQYQHDKS
jgi:glycerol-3-phosphate O-acyltransferase